MAKSGVEHAAPRAATEQAAVEAGEQPGRIREAGHGGYRRVFACATGTSDSPDEERTSAAPSGAVGRSAGTGAGM